VALERGAAGGLQSSGLERAGPTAWTVFAGAVHAARCGTRDFTSHACGVPVGGGPVGRGKLGTRKKACPRKRTGFQPWIFGIE